MNDTGGGSGVLPISFAELILHMLKVNHITEQQTLLPLFYFSTYTQCQNKI